MVESTAATAQGDGKARNVIYAKWREDKEADPGYSKELVNIETPADVYDNMDNLPQYKSDCKTIIACFLQTVERKKDDEFMGTRMRNPDGSFGAYTWQTWG